MRILCATLALLAAGCNDGINCDTRTTQVGDTCIPSSLPPGIPAVLEVREACAPGCSGMSSCSALFRNGQVVLEVSQDVCSDALNARCADQGCQHRVVRCVFPALPAGDYTLVVPGGPSRPLHVEQGGTASCRFPLADGGVQ